MSTPYYQDEHVTLWHGDCLAVMRSLPDTSVDCVVTSPPYFGLRDYGVDGQLGAEASTAEYVENMRALFAEVRRVLADDGTLWLNLGDSYTGNATPGGVSRTLDGASQRIASAGRMAPKPGKPKNLLGIPWRVAFALQDDGWTLRNSIIWHKPNAMPESVTDRLSTRHENVFMLSKRARYWFDLDPIREPHTHPGDDRVLPRADRGWVAPHADRARAGIHHAGRNPGDVWTIATQPYPGAHFAVMPSALAERCILAGCKPGGTVLDPFSGSGTTGMAAAKHGRRYVGIDLNADYLDLSLRTRLQQPGLDFGALA